VVVGENPIAEFINHGDGASKMAGNVDLLSLECIHKPG